MSRAVPTEVVLLATRPASHGGPVALLAADGRTVLDDLLAPLLDGSAGADLHVTQITVVTRTDWHASIEAVVPAGIAVHGVDDVAGLLTVLLEAGPAPAGDRVVLDAGVVADPLSLGRITDRVAAGTRVLGLPGPPEDPAGLRSTRGRVVAAGSPWHDVVGPDAAHARALRVGASDRGSVAALTVPLEAVVDGAPEAALADPLPLVTVALVRTGIPVAPVAPLRGGVWRCVSSLADLQSARAELAAVDLEAKRLAAAVKAEDGFFTTFLVSTYSRYLARAAARRGLTPDQVTWASLLLGAVAAVAFATGRLPGYVFGAVALQAAFTLDCVDGQLARYARVATVRGAWLDAVFDRGKEYLVYLGLAVGGVRAGQGEELWLLAAAALALQTVRHVVDLGYDAQQRADAAAAAIAPLSDRDGGRSPWEPVAVTIVAAPAGGAHEPDADGGQHLTPQSVGSGGVRGQLRTGLAGLRRGESVALVRWLKRIVVLPIGERFALISVVVVVASPRTVFLWLLGWGLLAAAYTTGGRLARSVA